MPLKGKNYVFAQPTLIAEIEFRGWTDDGNLRHASYKGLREIQDNPVQIFPPALLNPKFSKTKSIAAGC